MSLPDNVVTDSNAPADYAILAYDFDGTITTRDTFALFLRYYAGTPRWAGNILRLLPTFVAYKLGRVDRHAVKRAVVKQFFAGEDAVNVEAKAECFARDVIPGLVRPAALAQLRAIMAGPEDKRESLYICSASIGPYLRHWAKGVGIAPDHVLATEMAVESHDGKESMSGLLHGYNVWGSNKVRRISDTFAPQSVRILESYGDTRGDREMLHAAQASFFRPFRV